MAGKSGRTIAATQEKSLKNLLFRWEGGLVLVFIAVLIFGSIISPNYNFTSVFREMPKYLAEIFMMYAMGYILVLGEIDISVGAIVCLVMTVGCFAGNAGIPFPIVVILMLALGTGCGAFNGLLRTRFPELPAMIITLGTQIIFRGIAEVSLGSGGSASYTNSKDLMKLATMIGPFPLAFFVLAIVAIIFIVVLAKTTFGRKLYAIGSNRTAAYYAGVPVNKVILTTFTLLGLMAGFCGLFLLSQTYGANTTNGQGFEMDVIAMCVFGGIATTGGKGNLIGATIAGFTIVCLRIALGQRNINTQLILVIIGILLIVSVLVPRFSQSITDKKKKAANA
ncbi:MAG: ABC transporter permease [Eubacterium sp.]|nr:ABC transporter permease [Eubacterium sp.]